MTSPAAVAQAMMQLPPSAFGTPSLVNPGSPPGPPGDEDGYGGDLPRRGSLILMDSLKELEQARPGYALAEEMYDGECGDLPMSRAIARLVEKSGANDVEDFNYAKVPVDATTDKLGIRAVTVAAGDEAEADDGETADAEAGEQGDDDQPTSKASKAAKSRIAEKAQEKLDQLRKANQMDAEEPQLLHRTSKYGDAYLFVWPVVQAANPDLDPDGDDLAPLDPANPTRTVGVDIYVNSALTVRAFYDQEQPLRMTHVLKSWEWADPDDPEADKPRCRATLYFPDRIERWVTKPGEQAKDREAWVPYLGADGQDEWPLPMPPGVDRIPFFHLRNDRPYGKPEHKAAYGPQRLINKLIAAHGTTIDFQIFPQRYALLDPKADNGLLNLIDPTNPIDEDDDPEGEGYSQLRADPSAVWRLTANAVGQFSPADPGTFIEPLDRYIKAISELCGIPLDRFTGYSTPPSGESRRVGNEVLYEKVRNRRNLYGATMSDAYEFALHLLGFEDVTVDIKWVPLDVAAGADDWNTVNTKIAVGVPVKVALVEAGYDDDEVESWLLDQGGADLARRVALLNSIGTAVQALSTGVAVGMVSSEQAAGIVARVLGQIGEQLPDLDQPVDVHPQQAQQQMELQNKMRGQQMAEHIAQSGPVGGPPGQGGGDQGQGGQPPKPAPLPEMPTPPPPVQVGGPRAKN